MNFKKWWKLNEKSFDRDYCRRGYEDANFLTEIGWQACKEEVLEFLIKKKYIPKVIIKEIKEKL